jgi:signal transduction histidine kinase
VVIVAVDASFVALDLASMQEALLRVTMEALINIVKHAGARTVKLEARGDTIALEVADDGRGFDVGSPPQNLEDTGWGVKIVAERALAVGADLRVLSAPGSGTGVEFLISERKWQ